ncbi:ABC transporter permease [Taibaiella koreensis]|uniref:ABC transporter permease n=1 Tax=Taibaiella koreensis TaxID=1268548 RepID=UPI000E59F55E|nr:ABC transporter permease [Taibaiella koreensis]
MPHPYSQFKAFAAVAKAALRSIAKSPSSVVFTIAFPLVFILVFGFLGEGSQYAIKVGIAPASDTLNPVYMGLKQSAIVKLTATREAPELRQQLEKGDISVLLSIAKMQQGGGYKVSMDINAADQDKARQLQSVIEKIVLTTDPQTAARLGSLLQVEQTVVRSRKFKTIDFILPGQLGFSLLAASVFGTAFVFFNLRQALVLKRFFATPIRREFIILGEGVARMLFQLAGALFIILVGHFFFGYTLVQGVLTVINMLVICAIGLLVFMSFGFIISGLARSEATIPPLSNIITLPQFLLAGTFFSVEAFPAWMQPVSKALPLTYLNNALREVAFEGASLWAVKTDIGILLLWGVIGYFIASRVFKWE